MYIFSKKRYMANSNGPFVPEIWAQEAVRLLYEDMIYAGIVHRDFTNQIANFGETVHTRKVLEIAGKRKQNDLDDVVDSDTGATDIEVKLNQRGYASFVIGDGERSKSMEDLIETHLMPAVSGVARMLDRVVGGQVYQFLSNRAGGLGMMTSSNAHDYLLDARGVMNNNKLPMENRFMGLASPTETLMQKVDLFKSAERRGDGGRALRDAMLGRLASFNTFLELNTPSVRGATMGTATTTAAAAVAGATSISSTATIAAGTYITIAGDMTPLRTTAVSGSGPYTITLSRPLLRDVASSAVLSVVATGLINQASAIAAGDTTAGVANGYPAGWMKEIVVDGTGVPVIGQLVSFKAAGGTVHSAEYCIIDATSTSILLDRPLENTLADNDVVCYGPNGDYNFGMQSQAVALVNRPLALPPSGTGVAASLGVYKNMSLRVTLSYDSKKQGTRVVVDGLFGVKPLDTARGLVLLG